MLIFTKPRSERNRLDDVIIVEFSARLVESVAHPGEGRAEYVEAALCDHLTAPTESREEPRLSTRRACSLDKDHLDEHLFVHPQLEFRAVLNPKDQGPSTAYVRAYDEAGDACWVKIQEGNNVYGVYGHHVIAEAARLLARGKIIASSRASNGALLIALA